MNAIDLLRLNFQTVHEFLEDTVNGVTNEQANWRPPGNANSIGANYGHILGSEDGVINGMLRGAAPLLASSFAGKTGMSEPPPQGFAWHDWATGVAVDLPSMQEYARAVYAATDAYLASLTEADLERELEMGPGGKRSLAWFLAIMCMNVGCHTGEIATLKGEQGLKGYAV